MALRIGELVGFIRADDSGMRRGLSDAELRMRGFQRDTEGRLRTLDGRFATLGEQIALGFRQAGDEGGRFGGVLGRLGGMAGGLAGVAGSVGRIAAMLGAAAPAAAGLAATLANIAPAGGVAVTAMLALKQATFAVQLGTQGMGDALKAALDPSKAAEFEEALAKLSPEARQFALAVRDLGPAWKELQQEVQDELFRGLAENLQRTAKSVLPVLRRELVNTSTALGDMAAGAMGAARELADNGTLGKAMGSASKGLSNLSGIPGVVVTALGQIAAAAGPSFEALTSAAAGAAFQIGDKLGSAFESGRMQEAIEGAIDLIGELAEVGANVGSILGSVFKAAQTSGGGFVGTLQEITGALADAFASPAVQEGLEALFGTMATLAKTAAPLLGQALGLIAPVLAKLGPPIQTLIGALGDALSPIIEALGPVLESAAGAFGALVEAIAPILPVLGRLIADLLPVLTPLFDALRQIFDALAPSIELIAETLGQTLSPILQALPALIQPLLDAFVELAEQQGPLLADLLTQLQPSFVKLGEAFGQVLAALGPLMPQLFLLSAQLFQVIAPYLPGLIDAFAQLALVFTTGLVWVIQNAVVPALQLLGAMLSGDTPAATAAAVKAMLGLRQIMQTVWSMIVADVSRKIGEVVAWIRGLPGRAAAALGGLPASLRGPATQAGGQLVAAIRQKIADAVNWIRGLPGRARSALGNLSGVLAAAGRSLISGFINGIRGMIGSVRSAAADVVSAARDFFPFSPAKKGPFAGKGYTLYSGRALMDGFVEGVEDRLPAIRSVLNGLELRTPIVPAYAASGVGALPGFASGATQQRVAVDVNLQMAGPEEVTRLIRGIVNEKGGGDVQLTFGRGKRGGG